MKEENNKLKNDYDQLLNNYNSLKDENQKNVPKNKSLNDMITSDNNVDDKNKIKNDNNDDLLKQNSDLIKQIEKLKKDAEIKEVPAFHATKTLQLDNKDENRNKNKLYKSLKVSNMAKQLESVLNRSRTVAEDNRKKDEEPITHGVLDFTSNDDGNNKMSFARSGRKKKSQKKFVDTDN